MLIKYCMVLEVGDIGDGGLGALKGPTGSLVMHAAGQGQLAADGAGRNGAFTAALLKHVATPGLMLEQMAAEIVQEVERSTGGAQTPEYVSRLKKFGLCLVPA